MATSNQTMLMIGAAAIGGFFLWQRSRKRSGGGPAPGTPGLVDAYANRLALKSAVIDETSGVVTYQDDPRGPTFGSFRDAARFNQARGRAV